MDGRKGVGQGGLACSEDDHSAHSVHTDQDEEYEASGGSVGEAELGTGHEMHLHSRVEEEMDRKMEAGAHVAPHASHVVEDKARDLAGDTKVDSYDHAHKIVVVMDGRHGWEQRACSSEKVKAYFGNAWLAAAQSVQARKNLSLPTSLCEHQDRSHHETRPSWLRKICRHNHRHHYLLYR